MHMLLLLSVLLLLLLLLLRLLLLLLLLTFIRNRWGSPWGYPAKSSMVDTYVTAPLLRNTGRIV